MLFEFYLLARFSRLLAGSLVYLLVSSPTRLLAGFLGHLHACLLDFSACVLACSLVRLSDCLLAGWLAGLMA